MRLLARSLLLFAALTVFVGCAAFSSGRPSQGDAAFRVDGMTPARMELFFSSHVQAIEGPSGAIRTQVDGTNVYLISDPANDRMRILAPIALVEGLDRRIFGLLLEANFNNSLDARYAVSEGAIYAAFLHPISSLTPELIQSALEQVVSLAKTFGASFSADAFRFENSQEAAR
jgi:hypothetical protein